MITFLELGNYGRLGNQLFQIASTIGIATKNDHSYSFSKWEYSKYFLNELPQVIMHSGFPYGIEEIKETSPYYKDIKLGENYLWYDLKGYFQSWKYFDHCKELIKYYFTPNFSTPPTKGTAGIHVRRGDYLYLQHTHPVLTMDYYNRAIDYFDPERYSFLVFSDDVTWCKENFIGNKFSFSEEKDEVKDLFLLSSCEHQIIANSSFSWWGAWLNESPNKVVIAPKNYVIGEDHSDRIPPEWITI